MHSGFKLWFDSAAVEFAQHCISEGWKERLALVEPPIAITLKRFGPKSACGIHGFNAFQTVENQRQLNPENHHRFSPACESWGKESILPIAYSRFHNRFQLKGRANTGLQGCFPPFHKTYYGCFRSSFKRIKTALKPGNTKKRGKHCASPKPVKL